MTVHCSERTNDGCGSTYLLIWDRLVAVVLAVTAVVGAGASVVVGFGVCTALLITSLARRVVAVADVVARRSQRPLAMLALGTLFDQ